MNCIVRITYLIDGEFVYQEYEEFPSILATDKRTLFIFSNRDFLEVASECLVAIEVFR